jgi:hypothetical protein
MPLVKRSGAKKYSHQRDTLSAWTTPHLHKILIAEWFRAGQTQPLVMWKFKAHF